MSEPRPGISAITALLRARAVPGRPAAVLVDGPAGSGKTVLAERLRRALDPAAVGACVVVHVDDLVPGWDGLAEAPRRLVDQVLTPLAAGSPARYASWDWNAGAPGGWVDVPAAAVVVVEGVGAGTVAAHRLAQLLVWVEAPAALRRERALARDGETFRPHWQRWADQEASLFARERPRDRADLVIDGSAPVPD